MLACFGTSALREAPSRLPEASKLWEELGRPLELWEELGRPLELSEDLRRLVERRLATVEGAAELMALELFLLELLLLHEEAEF